MIAILLPAAGIDAGRLQMAIRIGAEPGIFISWRKADRVQPVDLIALGDALPLGVEIGPVPAHPLARDARLRVAAMPQHAALYFPWTIAAHKRAAAEGVPAEGVYKCRVFRIRES